MSNVQCVYVLEMVRDAGWMMEAIEMEPSAIESAAGITCDLPFALGMIGSS